MAGLDFLRLKKMPVELSNLRNSIKKAFRTDTKNVLEKELNKIWNKGFQIKQTVGGKQETFPDALGVGINFGICC